MAELVRLMDWLSVKGFSAEEIVDCIRFIASDTLVKNVSSHNNE